MATIFDGYFGAVDEVAYGTGLPVTKFYELTKESINGKYERIESAGLRNGTYAARADRFVPNPKGAAGDMESEVINQGYAFWLKHMLGTVTPTGTSPKTYAATVGPLKGKSFTAQANRVDSTGLDNVYTYEGGKVASWELSNAVDGLLMLALTFDFAKETIGAGAGAYAKATVVYPTTGVLLSFVGATVTVGGTPFDAKDVSVKCDNGLKVDRYGIRANGTTKLEPLEDALRNVEVSFNGEFQSVAHEQRVASLTASGVLAVVSMKWQTPDTLHSVQVDVPACRFDDATVNIGGQGMLEQKMTGTGLTPAAGGSPVTVTIITPDATA